MTESSRDPWAASPRSGNEPLIEAIDRLTEQVRKSMLALIPVIIAASNQSDREKREFLTAFKKELAGD